MNKWETIIKDKDETIKRLQEELKEKSDFIFKLIDNNLTVSHRAEKMIYNYIYNCDHYEDDNDCVNCNIVCWARDMEEVLFNKKVRKNKVDKNSNISFPNLEEFNLEKLGIYKNKIRRNIHQDNYATTSSHEYLPYDTKICPHCGGRIKHPYTGEVTSEQIDEDMNTCLLIEVIDEYDNTLGYEAICKKDWKHEN